MEIVQAVKELNFPERDWTFGDDRFCVQLRWHIWPTFLPNFFMHVKFLQKMPLYFSIPWCKKVKNDQKLKSKGGGGGGSCLNLLPGPLFAVCAPDISSMGPSFDRHVHASFQNKIFSQDPKENEKRDVSDRECTAPNPSKAKRIVLFMANSSGPASLFSIDADGPFHPTVRIWKAKRHLLNVPKTSTVYSVRLQSSAHLWETLSSQPISELDILRKRQALSRAFFVNSNLQRRKKRGKGLVQGLPMQSLNVCHGNKMEPQNRVYRPQALNSSSSSNNNSNKNNNNNNTTKSRWRRSGKGPSQPWSKNPVMVGPGFTMRHLLDLATDNDEFSAKLAVTNWTPNHKLCSDRFFRRVRWVNVWGKIRTGRPWMMFSARSLGLGPGSGPGPPIICLHMHSVTPVSTLMGAMQNYVMLCDVRSWRASGSCLTRRTAIDIQTMIGRTLCSFWLTNISWIFFSKTIV